MSLPLKEMLAFFWKKTVHAPSQGNWLKSKCQRDGSLRDNSLTLLYHGSNMINSCGTSCNNISLVTSFVIHVAAIRTPIHHLKDTELTAICAVSACKVLWISSAAIAAQFFSPGSWSCRKRTSGSDLDGLSFRTGPMLQHVQILFWCFCTHW